MSVAGTIIIQVPHLTTGQDTKGVSEYYMKSEFWLKGPLNRPLLGALIFLLIILIWTLSHVQKA